MWMLEQGVGWSDVAVALQRVVVMVVMMIIVLFSLA